MNRITITFFLGMTAVVSFWATVGSAFTNDETRDIQFAITQSNMKLLPETDSMAQVTSVAQLSDVQPTDWAFQALQSLVERYGIIAGYPDGTFQGHRAITRYEFAAGLNAALNQIGEFIAAGNGNLVTQEDLATLQKLQAEFAAELSTLRGRIDMLEVRTQQLEVNKVSPITQLKGEVIFAVSDAFGGQVSEENNTVFQQRGRLYLQSSFTGKDRLKIRLDFGNFEQFNRPTEEGRLGFDSNTDGKLELSDVEYRFPLGERLLVYLEINDAGLHDFTDVINPFLEDSGDGAISRFGRRNPIYRTANVNAGLGARFKLNNDLSFDFGYLAGEPNSSSAGAGLFNGDYGAMGQLTLDLGDRLGLGLTYIHSYAGAGEGLDTGTGSTAATLEQVGLLEIERPTIGNSYGIQANYKISDNFAIGGWVGYTAARVVVLGDAQIWNYALTLAFPDLGKEGNLGGILIGMEPKLTGTSSGLRSVGQLKDPDTSLHIEGFYRYQMTDNIAITPGVIWLTAPNHNEENDDIIIGTIRTTFEF